MILFEAGVQATRWDTVISAAVILSGLAIRECITYINGLRREHKRDLEHEERNKEIVQAEAQRILAVRAAREVAQAAMTAATDAKAAANIVVSTTAETAAIAAEASKDTKARLKQIHILVNSRLTAALKEIASLKNTVALLSPGNKIAQQDAAIANEKSQAKDLVDKQSQDEGIMDGELFIEDFDEVANDDPKP